MKITWKGIGTFATILIGGVPIQGTHAEPNYDEAAVPAYTLPDVLAGPDGKPAASAADWQARCRPHQFALLERFVYGRRLPVVPVSVVGEVERADVELAEGVQARRLQARLRLGTGDGAPTTDVLLYLPRLPDPSPVFLHLNFKGNQAETADPAVHLSRAWLPDDQEAGIVGNRATEASRGTQSRRWPVSALVQRGFGLATACYGDVFPDRPDGRRASALAALGRPIESDLAADEPGAIATWAWQLSRILDWLVTLPEVDAERVAVVGHSRNGKAALWAGACDERFAMVVSNESGCGGAALERRLFGERIADITTRFPHWFCPAFATYAGREQDLPVDAHVTLAMAAPRPLYVASAVEDHWADPRGEFLAAVAAEPVWKLFSREGLGTADYPPVGRSVGDWVVYHVRAGRHDLLAEDWEHFADLAFRKLSEVGAALGPASMSAAGHGVSAAAPDFRPVQEPLPVKPPAGAILLFGDGSEGPPKFVAMDGGPIDWRVQDGTLVVTKSPRRANHVVSEVVFRDADIHAEFLVDKAADGNSGLYIHGLYEMQILDSFGVEPPTDQDEGSLYRFAKPLVNASRPAGEWQVYDIRYTAPRRDAAGNVTQPGTITAWLNGRLVQDGVEFTEPRSPYIPYRYGVTEHLRTVQKRLAETGQGPLFLQEHGSPTRFRNVWIVPR
ncbi:MAG: family 16 glycoside hydrolase [Planctomycetota bacterium]